MSEAPGPGAARAPGAGHGSSRWVRLHGWPKGLRVFPNLVDSTAPGLAAGDRVAVLDREGRVFGWGFYHPRSAIRVRIVRLGTEPFDDAWLRERAAAAVRRRLEEPAVAASGNAWRAVHAEGDDLPALIVDRYADVLSAQIYSVSALPVFEAVLAVLHAELGTRHHRLAFGESAARPEGEQPFVRRSEGCPARVRVEEHGLRFEVHLEGGHKTGFFCDQRENRRRVAAMASGRSVLDVCCNTGGFSLAAWQGGAAEVLGVDLDEQAVEQAGRNANLNQARVKFVHADAFSYMRTLDRNQRRFELVVLDPPKFIPNHREREDGIARYHDLSKLAMRLLAPGGRLLSCSCSGLLALEDFLEIHRRAARSLGRTVRLVETTGAGRDHPVRLDAPEGGYLKALWLQAD